LLLAFIYLKRNAAGRRNRFVRQYRPLRDQPDAPADGDAPADEGADGPVDEELVRQLRQYQADHGKEEPE